MISWLRRLGRRRDAANAARWVVVDCETTGLDPARDSLIAIGAVAVRGRRIPAGDSFEAHLRPQAVGSRENALVHGIGRGRQEAGAEPSQALRAFLAYAGASPRVAFRAAFDRTVIERALRAIGQREAGAWLDVAELLPVLFPHAAAASATLDAWLAAFSLTTGARHDALGDAYATAQLFQIALDEAGRQGFGTVDGVLRAAGAARWTGP